VVRRLSDCRDRVIFQRRPVDGGEGDGAGNFEGDWTPMFGPRRVELTPRKGGEEVVAGRLQGVSAWDLWVLKDRQTSTVDAGDRVVDARNPKRIFNIRFAEPLTGDGQWILMQLEAGVAT
jgi:hypothetical protein